MDVKKKSDELVFAIKELAFQSEEREKQTAKLKIANKAVAFQNQEKEQRAAELKMANIELAFQNKEKEKRAAELSIANIELAFQNGEKEKTALELTIAYKELKKTGEYLKEHIKGLEEMMFMTSHQVRQPIANILSISNLLDDVKNSPEELKELIDYIKESALALDTFTKELTAFINALKQKGKGKLP